MYKNFAEILTAVQALPMKRVAVAVAQDEEVLRAVAGAREQRLAEFVLVGDKGKIQEICAELQLSIDGVDIIHEIDERKAAHQAVAMVAEGHADVLMKGHINTADLLRAVLDRDHGLRAGRILSHVALYDIPHCDRLLLVTDGGMNVAPTLQQKADIIQNSVQLAKMLGIVPAKVAVLAAVEVVNPDMPSTIEAAALSKMADRGQIKGALVDGPLALDNAISLDAAKSKGIRSEVAGRADILVVPDIESGNIFGKSLLYFAQGKMAGLIMGAAKPIIVTSRADTAEVKIMSIAISVLVS